MKKVCKKDVFNNMGDGNIFFFNSNGGTTGPKTTQDELHQWLDKIVPQQSAAVVNKDISIVKLCDAVSATGDNALIDFVKEQLKEMKEQNEKLQNKADAEHKELMTRLAEKDLNHQKMMEEQNRLRMEIEAQRARANNGGGGGLLGELFSLFLPIR